MGAPIPSIIRRLAPKVRPQLIIVGVFLVLLGLLNILLVNQRVILQLFYVPVVFAAWRMCKRDAVGIAGLGALMVMAYAIYVPAKLVGRTDSMLRWLDLVVWGGILVVTAYVVSVLRNRTEQAMRNLQRAYSGVLAILTKFIQTVDVDTEAHSVRVSTCAARIADEMGLGQAGVEEARIAGLLHDVGKVEVSVEILRKAAVLSEQELSAIQTHTTRGSDMVKPVGGMLSGIADDIENHHEKFDGSGYRGLKAEQIPMTARIIAVADALDALVSDRPYRKGVGIFEALDTVQAASGTHFDPKVVAALKRMVDRDGENAVAVGGAEQFAAR